jgi:hypothetical protein
MKLVALLFLFFISLQDFGQVDTIFSNNQKIGCTIKEITTDAVKFSYPGEDLVNSVYKNTIQKIIFKSGRVQTFAESTSFKRVDNGKDYSNVSFTFVPSEVQGLVKLGDVSSKAKGTTVYSSMTKVKERAERKIKIQAAMMGANIVFVAQNNTTGNQVGSYFQAGKSTETNLNGVAYSSEMPIYDDFAKLVGQRKTFQTYEKYELAGSSADLDSTNFSKPVDLENLYNENGLIMFDANIKGVDGKTFRVIEFSAVGFTLVWKDGDRIYNFLIKI